MLGHFGWRAVACRRGLHTRLLRVVPGASCSRCSAARTPPAIEWRRGDAARRSGCRPHGGSPASTSPSWRGPSPTPHYPALFVGGFLFFLGFDRATAAYSDRSRLQDAAARRILPRRPGHPWGTPGLVDCAGARPPVERRAALHGVVAAHRFQRQRADHLPGDAGATSGPEPAIAVVQGAVTGGGLTVIANAPNPAGQALLARFFEDAIQPLKLLAAAVLPTLIAAAAFLLL